MSKTFFCCFLVLWFVSGSNYLYQVTARDPHTGEIRIGFIDKTGKIVIGYDQLPKTIVGAGDFREGRALVYVKTIRRNEATEYPGTIAGYVDQTGAMVITPQFDVGHDFNEGLAYVEVDAENFKGFINREGQKVITLKAQQAKDFHEGLAAAEAVDNKKWGYIDRSGKWVVGPQYDFADDFSEGLAGVVSDGKYGFINKQGVMVIPARFDVRRSGRHPELLVSSGRFKEGMAPVIVDRKYGYINRRGVLIIRPQFYTAQEFSEGLAFVVAMDETSRVVKKVGWINRLGHWVINEVKGHISSNDFSKTFTDPNGLLDWRFSEGLVPFSVYRDGKSLLGYIDRTGNAAIEAKEYNRVGRFIGGIAWVEIRDYGMSQDYGYIDKQGRFIWRSR